MLKSLDVQALFYDLEPDYEYCDMEQIMSYYWDSNAPYYLNAAVIAAFECDKDIVALNEEIAKLTKQIGGQPDSY